MIKLNPFKSLSWWMTILLLFNGVYVDVYDVITFIPAWVYYLFSLLFLVIYYIEKVIYYQKQIWDKLNE